METFESFEARPDEVARTRRFVAQTLRSWGIVDVDTPMLVVSELASNVVLHAGTEPFRITVDLQAATVRIEVRDAATDDLPSLRSFDEETAGGRGLHIVERLSRSWGARPEGYGKVVWVEIEVHR
jgi:anti-sigma regulatory factor (Ser/Thr protein kinase)